MDCFMARNREQSFYGPNIEETVTQVCAVATGERSGETINEIKHGYGKQSTSRDWGGGLLLSQHPL